MASDAETIGMTRELRQRRRRFVPSLVLALAAAGLCYAFPPVRFVRVAGKTEQPLPADVAAREFWEMRLVKSLDHAVDAETLLAAIRTDANAARDKHSRRLGVGGSYYYFLSGTGRVVRKDASSIGIAIGSGSGEPEIVIETGPLFGNAVRDGTGLLDVNDYPNSQDFNRLSEELNKLVRSRVLPSLRERATVGSRARFTGVAEVADEDTDLRPLPRVVPVAAEVQ